MQAAADRVVSPAAAPDSCNRPASNRAGHVSLLKALGLRFRVLPVKIR